MTINKVCTMMKPLYCLLLAVGLSACSTMEYLTIETYNPAEVSYPKNVHKLLVVNNAVPQESTSGYLYKLFNIQQDTVRLKADSALYDACLTLGQSIVEQSFFDDVLFYQDGTRRDGHYMEDQKLTPAKVKVLCHETGTDAVISLDRMLFEMNREVQSLGGGAVSGTVDVKVAGVIRSYLPERDQPLATIYVQDSVYWAEEAESLAYLNQILPTPDEALRVAAKYIATRATPNFVPHWDDELRWIYKGEGARWKEATAYASAGNWKDAMECWVQLYEHSSWKGQAKAASNIALYYEMQTQLKEAFEWASKSHELFAVHQGNDQDNTKRQQLYAEALGQRIRLDQKLNSQIE